MERDERLERLLREARELAARRFAELAAGDDAAEGRPDSLVDELFEAPGDDEIVAALRAAPRVTPRPAFRAAARARLMARIAVATPPRPRGHTLPRVVLRLAASLVLLFGLTSGAIVASAGSLPDEPLYVVKAAVEEVQLRTAAAPEERVALHLAFAARRIAELEAASATRPAAAAAATERYRRELRAAAEVLREEPKLGQTRVATRVEGELRQHEAALNDVLRRAPADIKPAVEQAVEVARQGREYVERVKAGEAAEPLAPASATPVSAAPAPAPEVTLPSVPPPPRVVAPAAPTPEQPAPQPAVAAQAPQPRPPVPMGEVRPVAAPQRPALGGKASAEVGDEGKAAPPIHGQPQPPPGALSPQPERTPTPERRESPVVAAEQRAPTATPIAAQVRATPTPTAPPSPSPTPTPAIVVPPLPLTPPAPAPRAQSQGPLTPPAPVVVAAPASGMASGSPPAEWRRAEEVAEPQPTRP